MDKSALDRIREAEKNYLGELLKKNTRVSFINHLKEYFAHFTSAAEIPFKETKNQFEIVYGEWVSSRVLCHLPAFLNDHNCVDLFVAGDEVLVAKVVEHAQIAYYPITARSGVGAFSWPTLEDAIVQGIAQNYHGVNTQAASLFMRAIKCIDTGL